MDAMYALLIMQLASVLKGAAIAPAEQRLQAGGASPLDKYAAFLTQVRHPSRADCAALTRTACTHANISICCMKCVA